MKPQLKKLALAVLIALGTVTVPAMAACPTEGATPFKAGPVSLTNGFPTYLQDSEGLALELCLSGDGSGICFFDPVVVNNQFSLLTGFGGEGFWWLAESTVATARVNTLVVMAAEAAYATEEPAPGDQFPFTRLRVRIDVADPGVYTLTYPYGQKSWVVTAAGRRAINDTADVQLAPNAMNQGVVGPWLANVGAPFSNPGDPTDLGQYLGNGTPLPATGSPCGTNFIRLEAKSLAGGTPLVIDPADLDGDGRTDAVSSNLFSIFGKQYAGKVQTPLTAAASYNRAADGSGRVNVFAKAPSTAALTANVGGTPGTMLREGDRHFTSLVLPAGSPLPAVTVTAVNNPPLSNNLDTTQSPAVADVVTITRAEATCLNGTCSLVVEASSSDVSGAPALTISGMAATPQPVPFVATGLSVVPATVTVNSAAGGSDSEPVKIINQ